MPITEIQSVSDAKARLTRYFLSGEPEEKTVLRSFVKAHIDDYAAIAYFLSDKPAFESALELASSVIWGRYNQPEVMVSRNRYTNAIANAGKLFGLSGQNSFVLVNEASALFGQMLKGGHLWKDSFAPGHGEFAHSYQWISWAARNHRNILQLYKGTQAMSWLPMFVKAEGAIELRRVFLWEWLLDCTRYQPKFDDQVRAAADSYLRKIGPKHGLPDAELWTREGHYTWSDVVGSVGLLVDEYPKANVLCADRYRNANNITDFVKTKNTWFIQAYETRRQRKTETREAQQKVTAVHRLIGGAAPAPSAQQQAQWAHLKPGQIYTNIIGGAPPRGLPNPGNKLQAIDIGKNVLLHHYASKQTGVMQQESGVGVRFDRQAPVGGLLKKQVRMVFHGMPGLMNAEVE